jgi:hypothetical protein
VSITAEPLTPSLGAATLIGAVGGVIVVFAVPLLDKFKIDDVVGAIPVHLFAGIWGTLAVVLTNSDATIGGQVISIVIVGVFVVVTSAIAWLILKGVMGIRVSAKKPRWSASTPPRWAWKPIRNSPKADLRGAGISFLPAFRNLARAPAPGFLHARRAPSDRHAAPSDTARRTGLQPDASLISPKYPRRRPSLRSHIRSIRTTDRRAHAGKVGLNPPYAGPQRPSGQGHEIMGGAR